MGQVYACPSPGAAFEVASLEQFEVVRFKMCFFFFTVFCILKHCFCTMFDNVSQLVEVIVGGSVFFFEMLGVVAQKKYSVVTCLVS